MRESVDTDSVWIVESLESKRGRRDERGDGGRGGWVNGMAVMRNGATG